MSVQFGVTLFMHKVREARKYCCNNDIDGNVEVDEFTVGGKETGVLGRELSHQEKERCKAVQYTPFLHQTKLSILKLEILFLPLSHHRIVNDDVSYNSIWNAV